MSFGDQSMNERETTADGGPPGESETRERA
jgi:hypothetical protein